MTTALRRLGRTLLYLPIVLGWLGAPATRAEMNDVLYVQGDTWQATMLATRAKLLSVDGTDREEVLQAIWEQLERDYPVACDWMLQDVGQKRNEWFARNVSCELEKGLLTSVAKELGDQAELVRRLTALVQENPPRSDRRWLDLYVEACEQRRAQRLATLLRVAPKLVFTKHYNLAGSHYAYTEGQSDAQAERQYRPGASLCLLEMDGLYGTVKTLLEDREGVIRDPDVSYDGRRVLFAWKKSDRLDDYHLYELDVASGQVRQLTAGLGFADYEGIYLPNADIVFNSTRCVQTVDCWWTEVSNLYTCDQDGRYLRRLSFDQVHTNYPQLLDDGRIVYTRWEYNDRGQIYPQPLYQMNSDGTNQTEFYGNNSFFPTSILHARGIPGTSKVVAIASGHHSSQAGKLVVIDPTRGRQENQGVQLIAPVRETPAVKIDAYGQDGEQWMYPYALNEREFIVTFLPVGRKNPHDRFDGRFGIFYMDLDGRRELLVSDPELPCNQAVPLVARTPAIVRPSVVDYRKKTGTYYVQDVYRGPGLQGIPRGTVKALRVVTIDYRAAGVGSNQNHGEAGGALISTPPAVGNGSWDPKTVLGTTPVYEDGSAMFQVPARTPVYFQALDANGHVVQTMRSWSTLQPGECASCVGCHENKNESPVSYSADSQAMRHGARELEPFYGPRRGFSFSREIQPILDRHCTTCHNDRSVLGADKPAPASPPIVADGQPIRPKAFSLLAETTLDVRAKRRWSDAYLMLTKATLHDLQMTPYYEADPTQSLVNWISAQSAPPMLPPYSAGAAKSRLIDLLRKGHEGVKLSQEELDKIACWIDLLVPYCGDYYEANAWTDEEKAKYDHFLAKRQRMEAMEARNVADLIQARGEARVTLASYEQDSSSAVTLTLAILDAAGKVVAQKRDRASPGSPIGLELARRFQPGDRIRVEGARHLAVAFDRRLGETVVFAPEGKLEYAVPTPGADRRATPYMPEAFGDEHPRMTVRPVTLRELDNYRNLACNPYDLQGQSLGFPHATSNSECRGEAVFAARNAIDGFRENRGHGAWPYQSWGPEQRSDVWWQVDFGREVEIDKVVISLRADFPHDKHWHKAALVFTDGQRCEVSLQKTGDRQVFRFPPTRTTSLRLTDLVQDVPLGWCALAEVEVWGRDPLPVATDIAGLAVSQ